MLSRLPRSLVRRALTSDARRRGGLRDTSRPVLLGSRAHPGAAPDGTAPIADGLEGSFVKVYALKALLALGSMFAGASVVHTIMAPDLTIPDAPKSSHDS